MLTKMLKTLRKLSKDRSGAIAVEFAMIAPVMVAMLYGLMEAGRYYWTQQSLDFAVQEASRYAALNSDASTQDIIDHAKGLMQGVNLERVIVEVTDIYDDNTNLTFKNVEASIPFNVYVAPGEDNSIEVSAKSKYLQIR